MRASLYEALGIAPNASEEEVQAALRRLIRKYYAKTRDGQGNVEEALRFINHASRILSDPDLRRRYNSELLQSDGRAEAPVAHVVTNAMSGPGEGSDVGAQDSDSGAPRPGRATEVAPGAAARNIHHPGLTEPVVAFGRPTLVTIALCVLLGVFIAAAIVLVMPVDAVQVAKQVLVWLTLTLLTLSAIYGIVHSLAWSKRRGSTSPAQALMPQTDLAILNWRREKSVYLGTNAPQEDASWIFQLRMAELERAKTGRTSEPKPWNRLGARLFDCALWGIILALLLTELRDAGIMSDHVLYWLSHPFVAPVLITGSWIVIETVLMASLGTTPGKWLFGCFVQFSISDAYAKREMRAQFMRSFKRAFRVWWQGMGCGFPLLAPILIAIAYERIVQNQETDWDFAQDCLVTHAPAGLLNTLTGIFGLAAMLWLYGVAWHGPLATTVSSIGTAVMRAAPALLPKDMAKAGSDASAGLIRWLGGASSEPAVPPLPPGASPSDPIDSDVASLFADRRAKIAQLKAEAPRLLSAGSYRKAAETCRAWADLDLSNAEAWRCLGQAQEGLGNHQEAVNAFRKAKQYAPSDRSIDAAIERSQKGIVGDFMNRYRK